MPSLAGLFGRKNKASSKQRANSNEDDSALSSPTAEYVTPDRSIPSSPNGRSTLRFDATKADSTPSSVYPSLAAPSGKIKLPFSRKKASASASTASVVTTFSASQDSHFGTPPRPSYAPPRNSIGAASDSDADNRRLRPPPSKSAIFAAYADPHSALSTRSLPSEHSPLTITTSNTSAPIPPPVPPKKGFFHWSKSSPSSPQPTIGISATKNCASPPQLSPTSPSSDPNSSFNLKSFRHIGPSAAASTSPNASNTSLGPPIARPRGASFASESSQRISVAAFREAQARRSTAGSPVPSNRAASPGPLLPHGTRPHAQHTAPAAVAQHQHVRQRRSSGLAYASDSSESEDEDEDDDDDEDSDTSPEPPRKGAGVVRRKRTVTRRGEESTTIKGRATKSEMGHSPSRDYTPAPRSQPGQVQTTRQNNDEQENGAETRPLSSLGFDTGTRPRASASTSALTPSAAAKRASILAAANAIPLPNANGKHHTRASSAHSTPAPAAAVTPSTSSHSRHPAAYSVSHSSGARSRPDSDSDSDSDDAPLATLLPPRRPGSALSSASNSSLRPKPLIDINELTSARLMVKSKSMDAQAFTGGATLLGQGGSNMTSPTASSSPVVTSVSPPTRFVSPPASPTPEVKEFLSSSGGGASSAAQRQPQQQLRSSAGMPMRRDTSPGGEQEDGRGQKRDGLGERLTRIVQLKAGSGSSSESGSGSGSSASSGSGNSKSFKTMPTIPAPTLPKTKSLPVTKITPTTRTISPAQEVEVEEDLAAVLGAGIALIRRTDTTSEESASSQSGSESESDGEEEGGRFAKGKAQQQQKGKNQKGQEKKEKEPDRIAPIPIKQRAPPPAFSVTSRPPLNRNAGSGGDRTSVASTAVQGPEQKTRQRSSTLIPTSSSSATAAAASASANANGAAKTNNAGARPGILNGSKDVKTPTSASTVTPASMPVAPAPRQRSSTLLPNSMSMSSSHSGHGHGHGMGGTGMAAMPTRPFAAVRRESPASSTGDSSSGRAPFTPRDGSELGVGSGSGSGVTGGTGTTGTSLSGGSRGWSGGVSGLMVGGKHIKRRSVSFEDDLRDVRGGAGGARGGGGKEAETPNEGEERRKERRRSEAKAAIELGNVINGRGPVVDDDDDDDLPINQTLGGGARMSTLNPMMAMNAPMPFGPGMSPGWNGMNMMGQGPGMFAPGQFLSPATADPNFMMAHQQAMMFAKQAYQMAVAQQAMAAAGDEWERGSTMGGFGSGGSVYGGTSPSVVGSPYAMSPMMNMGMGMGMQTPGNGWSTGSVIFPGTARSMYGGGGISSSRSEYGGGGARGGGQWSSSKSSYGESFGPSPSNRHSKGYFPPVPPIPSQAAASSGRGAATSRSRTTSQPASPSRGVRRAPPPSSWKAGV
ncbi:hypothetical protein LshimejAT787_1401530 [Lyophyllum shimeji]|uniref:Uncharacterized protein n=1 Tax=Lyophyllum shimeji TaxID=47721 RepID=A0A9P3PXY7_LYOSH|nr:hypothetical protein LshimejAT787_1401530 [Lyophyllum shimeji]